MAEEEYLGSSLNPDIQLSQSEDEAFLKKCKTALQALEIIRLEKLDVYNFRKKLGIPAAFLVTPITGYIDYLFLFAPGDGDKGAGLTFIVLGVIYWWVTQPKRQYATAYKKEILPEIAKLFGDLTYKLGGKIGMVSMKPSKIVPRHDRYQSEDHFSGEYKGVNLEFSEIELEVKRRSKDRTYYDTVFKGLAIMLDIKQKRFYGHTILDKNKAAVFEWFKEKSAGLERAEMVDPEFEKYFDAYTNDQVEARYLIDPVMIENLNGLYREYEGNKMMAAFYNNKMLILVASNHNHFEPADLTVPAADPYSILNMKREVGQVLSIIDRLSLYDSQEVEKLRQTIAA